MDEKLNMRQSDVLMNDIHYDFYCKNCNKSMENRFFWVEGYMYCEHCAFCLMNREENKTKKQKVVDDFDLEYRV